MELWYAIVDLLPFEWAESGSMYFMKNALLAVLVISPLFGILSTMVVHSRMSFFSDALGHSAFTGMAIGALCGFAEPAWAAVVFAVVFAVLFNVVRRRTAMASDTVIGVFSSTAVALGIFISTLGSRSFTKFNSLLIGDILSVEPSKIGVLALILLLARRVQRLLDEGRDELVPVLARRFLGKRYQDRSLVRLARLRSRNGRFFPCWMVLNNMEHLTRRFEAMLDAAVSQETPPASFRDAFFIQYENLTVYFLFRTQGRKRPAVSGAGRAVRVSSALPART